MTDHERVIAGTRARIAAVLGLRTAVVVLSAWLVAWGVAVLVLRGVLLMPWQPLLWGFIGVAVAAVAGVMVGARRRPSTAAVRAMLDAHWNCGGLLMAAGDLGSSAWPIPVPDAPQPRIRWQGHRQIAMLLCCAVFVLASFLVPIELFDDAGSRRLLVGAEIEKLAEKVDLLKEEQILPPERAKSLEAALEQLEHDASGDDPAKTWEAMDHLEQAIANATADAAEDAARNAERAARAEELASALDQAQDEMAARELGEAMKTLADDVQQAAEEDHLLAGELPEALKEQLRTGALDARQLAELARTLGKCKACDLAKLDKLAASKLIDGARLAELRKQLKTDPEALKKMLCECQNASEVGHCIAGCKKPGRGGINRGRGDAEMTWNDGANRDDVAFQEKVLPPGAALLQESRLQGISIADPTAEHPSDTSGGGSLDPSTAGRGSARTQVILPEHRKIIGRYFTREPAGKTAPAANP
ncbi:MAG TPA: hypothetical protein VHZ24_07245 [Pirellulales bacterium]|nr:hypothetical protein [Pirellulales bacterium]